MQEKKKILLLGGTGALGVYMAPELLSMGYQVYITSRKPHKSNERNLIYLTGNAKDMAFIRPLLEQKFDAIVDFMIYKTPEFEARYMELLDATPHYLFLSSYRVYGDNHGKPITEESPRLLDSVQDEEYLATDEYGLTKARQENLLRASGRKNFTILRPAITYSKERFQLGTMEAAEFLKRALAGKAVIFPRQMLDKQATMSWAGDVGRMMARLVFNEKAMGETFTVSTAEHHTWREVMNYYVELLDMKVKLVDLSVYAEVFPRPYQIKYDRMLDRVVDNTKALEATGMRQEDLMPLKDGLKIELTNFSKAPKYTGNTDRSDKMIDELTRSRVKEFWLKVRNKLLRPVKNMLDNKRDAAPQKTAPAKKSLLKRIGGKVLSLPGLNKLKEPLKKVVKLHREKKLSAAIKRKVKKLLGGK